MPPLPPVVLKVKGGEERLVSPPDTKVVWPLIRDKLDVKKYPPYPPKGTSRGVTGSSSARKLLRICKRIITERLTRSENRRLAGVVGGTTGYSSNRFVCPLGVGKRPTILYNQGEDETV